MFLKRHTLAHNLVWAGQGQQKKRTHTTEAPTSRLHPLRCDPARVIQGDAVATSAVLVIKCDGGQNACTRHLKEGRGVGNQHCWLSAL